MKYIVYQMIIIFERYAIFYMKSNKIHDRKICNTYSCSYFSLI